MKDLAIFEFFDRFPCIEYFLLPMGCFPGAGGGMRVGRGWGVKNDEQFFLYMREAVNLHKRKEKKIGENLIVNEYSLMPDGVE